MCLKEGIFVHGFFFFFGNTMCGHMKSFVGKMTTGDKKPVLLTGGTLDLMH